MAKATVKAGNYGMGSNQWLAGDTDLKKKESNVTFIISNIGFFMLDIENHSG